VANTNDGRGMKMHITVDEAIRRGNNMIKRPIYFFVLVYGMSITILSGTQDFKEFVQEMDQGEMIALWLLICLLPLLIIWLYRSVTITKWKIWAFTYVDDILELKKTALKRNILFPDDYFLTRTEIRTSVDTQRLAQLTLKVLNAATNSSFEDDRRVPPETIIKRPRYVMTWVMLSGTAIWFLLMSVKIIAALIKDKEINFDFKDILIFLFVTIGPSWFYFNEKQKKDLRIVINEKGISTPETGFIEWSLIQNEHVEIGVSRDAQSYFVFDIATSSDEKGSKTKRINMLGYNNITLGNLEHLMRVYRGRYEHR